LEINAEIVAGLFIPAAFDAVLKVSHLFQDLFYFLRAEHIGAVRIFCFLGLAAGSYMPMRGMRRPMYLGPINKLAAPL
jgi:hypothetical protein